MFERRRQPVLPRIQFYRRLARSLAVALAFMSGSLALGMFGYHWIAHLSWIDALLNAAMILTGMGPVDAMKTDSAKLFASLYALFSGVAFLSAMAVLVAPVVHRFLHKFHAEAEEEDEAMGRPKSRSR
jgi:hypothetical protein